MNNPMSRCPFWAQKNRHGLSRRPSEAKFRDLTIGTPPGAQHPQQKKKSKQYIYIYPPSSSRYTALVAAILSCLGSPLESFKSRHPDLHHVCRDGSKLRLMRHERGMQIRRIRQRVPAVVSSTRDHVYPSIVGCYPSSWMLSQQFSAAMSKSLPDLLGKDAPFHRKA